MSVPAAQNARDLDRCSTVRKNEDFMRVPLLEALGALVIILCMFVALALADMLPHGYFSTWGPDVTFMRARIDTPLRLLVAVGVVAVNTAVRESANQYIGVWKLNSLDDHKTPRAHLKANNFQIYLTTLLYSIFLRISIVINIFSLTSTALLLAVQVAIIVCIQARMTGYRLLQKTCYFI